jgi:hypothetical protein
MKVLLLAAGLLLCAVASAQDYLEFRDQPNGLMYSDASMKALRRMVDSLNLRFKTCDLSRTFYSHPQARIHNVVFKSKTNNLKSIMKDIDQRLPFDSIVKKYRKLIDDKDTTRWCILLPHNDDDDADNKYRYLEGNPESGYDSQTIDSNARAYFVPGQLPHMKGKWSYTHLTKDWADDDYTLYCSYFPEDFRQQQLPARYAALIQYVDCMIDTNATIFLKNESSANEKRDDVLMPVRDYIYKSMCRDAPRVRWLYYLDDTAVNFALKSLASDQHFLALVNTAVDKCVKNGVGDDGFDAIAGELISAGTKLTLKRSRIVWGRCSQDEGPRIHARSIALLAAETNSWDIFLRSHLDIMNDRFNRMSDGSYAYAARKTYLKELEELNLNVTDLLLGLTLHAQNVAGNHYYGTVWRLGWALTESKERKQFEVRLIEMLKDAQLDSFNRGLLFMLFASYVQHLDDKKEANGLINKIKNNKQVFPKDLHNAIASLKLDKD